MADDEENIDTHTIARIFAQRPVEYLQQRLKTIRHSQTDIDFLVSTLVRELMNEISTLMAVAAQYLANVEPHSPISCVVDRIVE